MITKLLSETRDHVQLMMVSKTMDTAVNIDAINWIQMIKFRENKFLA
jgi:hypothetical protein